MSDTPKTFVSINGQTMETPKNTPSRIFRGAWEISGDNKSPIIIDMEKARNIHRDNLRLERKPLLEALDIKKIRADEEGKSSVDIVNKKNKLRDITEDLRIQEARTPEELEVLTIDELLN